MPMSAQDIYNQAAAVRSQTGVDPAIIASIVQTETNLGYSPPFNLGIGTAAVRGGEGSSGGSIASPNNYGGTQPSGFWTYQNGAEAAQAFANYIKAYQPALAPLLNNADAFFNPTGPISTSNYYVPTAGEAARHGSKQQAIYDYYAHWFALAQQFVGGAADTGSVYGLTASSDPSSRTSDSSGGASMESTSGQERGLTLANFGPWSISIGAGVLWSILFLGGAVALLLVGVYLVFRQQINSTIGRAADVAAIAA